MNEDKKLLEEAYDEIILHEKLVETLGNLALDIVRFMKCKQGQEIPTGCPSAEGIIQKLIVWIENNQHNPMANKLASIIHQTDNADSTIVNIYQQLKYNYS